MLAEATLLTFPSDTAPLSLTTDASSKAIGAVLEQNVGGNWVPVAFYSKTLKKQNSITQLSTGNFWQYSWQ